MKKLILPMAISMLAAAQSQAAQLEISVKNISGGNTFTPVLVAAHSSDTYLYKTGTMASDALAMMAEGGDLSGLADMVASSGAGVSVKADGMTPAGMSNITSIDSMDYKYLSLTAMILPTNDGFVGLDSWMIPPVSGTYTIRVNSYDAGSELNDEIVNGGGALGVSGIPGAPGGQGGINGMGIPGVMESNYVRPHPGVIGDFEQDGGYSDVNAAVHKWEDPIALVTVKVTADKAMPDMWNGNKVSYEYGDILSYMGNYYMVTQPHTSLPNWSPLDAHALFEEIMYQQ